MSALKLERWFWISALVVILGITAMNTMAGSEESKSTGSEKKEAESSKSTESGAKTETKGEKKSDEKTETASEEEKPKKRAHSAHSAPACLASELAIEDIRQSREEIEVKSKELALKENELKAREKALQEEIKTLTELRDSISKTQEQKAKAHAEKIAKLVETILNMSPKAAAKLLASVEEDLAVAAMNQMDTLRLGKIMSLMEPSKSSQLSEMMVGFGKTVKKVESKELTQKGGEKQNGKHERNTSSELHEPDGAAKKPGITKAEKSH